MIETRVVSRVKMCACNQFHSTAEKHIHFRCTLNYAAFPFYCTLLSLLTPAGRTHLAMRGGLAGPERLIKSVGKSHHLA